MSATPTDTANIELLGVFDSALKNAGISLELTKTEPLGGVASEYFTAFQTARDALASKGELPIIPGNDPHNVSSNDQSPLRVAMSGVYGFTVTGDYTSRSPHTIQTLRHLQALATEIHSRGLCIFT